MGLQGARVLEFLGTTIDIIKTMAKDGRGRGESKGETYSR